MFRILRNGKSRPGFLCLIERAPQRMSIARHHNEWLSLVPNSGPFLSLPVLTQAFPQGLDAHDTDHARQLRMAFDEWDDNQLSRRPDPGIHRAWIKFLLAETLGYDDLLAEGQAIPQTLKSEVAEYGESLRPDWIVNDPSTKKTRLIVQVYPRSQPLTKPVASARWKTSPDTRMMQLLHDTGIRLGIVTNPCCALVRFNNNLSRRKQQAMPEVFTTKRGRDSIVRACR